MDYPEPATKVAVPFEVPARLKSRTLSSLNWVRKFIFAGPTIGTDPPKADQVPELNFSEVSQIYIVHFWKKFHTFYN